MSKIALARIERKYFRAMIFCVIVIVGIVFFEYSQWAKTPELIVNEIYNAKNDELDKGKDILEVNKVIKELKKEKYSQPLVGSHYSNGIWYATVDFMMYTEKNDVIGGKTLLITFRSEFDWLSPFHPKLVEIIDFKELERYKSN